jgi:hypothetical protein
VQCGSFSLVADAGDDPKRKVLDDGRAVRSCAGFDHSLGLKSRGVQPRKAGRAAIGNEDFTVVSDGAGDTWKSRQRRFMLTRIVINHFDCAARGMRDEDPPGLWIECGMVEAAVRSVGYLDNA